MWTNCDNRIELSRFIFNLKPKNSSMSMGWCAWKLVENENSSESPIFALDEGKVNFMRAE